MVSIPLAEKEITITMTVIRSASSKPKDLAKLNTFFILFIENVQGNLPQGLDASLEQLIKRSKRGSTI